MIVAVIATVGASVAAIYHGGMGLIYSKVACRTYGQDVHAPFCACLRLTLPLADAAPVSNYGGRISSTAELRDSISVQIQQCRLYSKLYMAVSIFESICLVLYLPVLGTR
ncbi:hypothetical protein J6590_013938 [Homalodisca vitripennis]|nr:hypothetical protein J6590_013938 [Homalodisca vitripennis]